MSTDTPTPETSEIIKHPGSGYSQLADHARRLERERDAARAELAAAHRRIHGDESDECVFCNTKHRSPVSTGNQEDPQCHLCTMEADIGGLRVERDAARARVAELEAELAKLNDPIAVHINMLRGTIATPSVELMENVWGHSLQDETMDSIEEAWDSKQTQQPLDSPDKPGWWWKWLDAEQQWCAYDLSEKNIKWYVYKREKGKWLPATPPPVPVMSEKEDAQ